VSGTRPPVAPRDSVALMDGYHSPQLDVEVRLNTNESPEPPPVAFTVALANALGDIAWNRYPDRAAGALRARVGELHGVGADEVFCANGSNEVLATVAQAYGGPGRTAVVFEPTYALHAHLAGLAGTTVVAGERRDDFTVDPGAAVALIREVSPSLVFVCSPNNPTGTVEDPATVRAIADAAASVGALVVVDEAYAQFADDTALDLVANDAPVVVTRTFSKTWSLAALRLGYLVGPRWLVAELDKVALPYHLDAVTQAAGLIALDHVADMEARVARVVAERTRVAAGLSGLGATVWPSGANFVLFRPPAPTSGPGGPGGPGGDADEGWATTVWERLVGESVLVRDCSSWPSLGGCLRVTVGTPGENDRFLAALARAVAQ